MNSSPRSRSGNSSPSSTLKHDPGDSWLDPASGSPISGEIQTELDIDIHDDVDETDVSPNERSTPEPKTFRAKFVNRFDRLFARRPRRGTSEHALLPYGDNGEYDDPYDDSGKPVIAKPREYFFDSDLTDGQLLVRKHLHTCCLVIIALSAVGAIIIYLRPVLLPFVMALLLTYTLTPLMDWLTQPVPSLPPPDSSYWANKSCLSKLRNRLRNWRLPPILAVIVAVMVAVGSIAIVVVITTLSIQDLQRKSGKYAERMETLIQKVLIAAKWLGVDFAGGASDIKDKLVMPVSTFLFETIGVILNELSDILLMLLFTVYLVVGSVSKSGKSKVSGVRAEIDLQIKRYIGLKVLISAVTGLCVGLALMMLSVDLAFLFGLFAFLLNFVPNVGAVIATLLPLPLVSLDPTKSWFDVLLAMLLPGTLNGFIGNFVEPRVFGKHMDMHPVVVLLSLMLWGSLWGPVGMVLAVPMAAIMKISLDHLDHPFARFLAKLLDGKAGLEREDEKKQDELADSADAMADGNEMTPLASRGRRPSSEGQHFSGGEPTV